MKFFQKKKTQAEAKEAQAKWFDTEFMRGIDLDHTAEEVFGPEETPARTIVYDLEGNILEVRTDERE